MLKFTKEEFIQQLEQAMLYTPPVMNTNTTVQNTDTTPMNPMLQQLVARAKMKRQGQNDIPTA
jgi:hypothetical protein